MCRLLWPAVTTLAMLALTVSLGVWQVQRLQWKRNLLAEIDRGETSTPVPLSERPTAFAHVIAEGKFAPSVARYGAEVRQTASGPAMGAHVLNVLRRAEGVAVLVDRGWAPIDWLPATPTGPVRIEGYVRPPESAAWSAASDDPVARRFYTLDPVKIAASLGAGSVAPFTLVALGPGGNVPEPAASLPRPPNDHLSYAITWFSLSAVLILVFAAFARQTLRKASSP